MEFDINRVYTAVNAEELKVGSKVICANTYDILRTFVESDIHTDTLKRVESDEYLYRFITEDESECALAYLVEPPEEKKLKWTDLKIGDIIKALGSGQEYMVIGIDRKDDLVGHIRIDDAWISDGSLAEYWEKVE